MKRILLTGATGSVGREVLRQLKLANMLDGLSILARDSNKNRRLLKAYSKKAKVFYGQIYDKGIVEKACIGQDVIIHLAALISPKAQENIEQNYKVNRDGTQNLVDCITKISPKAFLIYSSSVATYGDRLNGPEIKVSDHLTEEPHEHYALAKIMAEKIIQKSTLDWSIFRLSAIMDDARQKPQGLMFEMPLETNMEIATIRDTARAFILSISKTESLKHKVFNLSGGKSCRITYQEYLRKAFKYTGLGKPNFPEKAFAKRHFHCANYADADKLEDILHFRRDDIDAHWQRFEESVPLLQRILTAPFASLIKKGLLKLSKPYQAYKNKDKERMNFFFGSD